MIRDKVLVTGATGFLGSYILRNLVDDGYTKVYAIKRKTSSLDLVIDIKDKVTWVDCDILDYLGMEDVVSKVDYVIHSAAMISFAKREISDMMAINVQGTAQLVDICLSQGIKKYIHISSISALGREKNGQTLNEDTKWSKSKYTTNYSISKYLSEQECYRAQAEGLQMAILNPALILGAGPWISGTSNIFKKVHEGMSFYTEGGTGIVDVRDVAILAVKLLESDVSGQRIIANGSNVTFKELMSEIAIQFGKKPPPNRLFPFLRELAWRVEFLKSIIANEKPIITKETMIQSSAVFKFENGKSIKLLEHDYIPWKKTIADSVKAYLYFVENDKLQVLNF